MNDQELANRREAMRATSYDDVLLADLEGMTAYDERRYATKTPWPRATDDAPLCIFCRRPSSLTCCDGAGYETAWRGRD